MMTIIYSILKLFSLYCAYIESGHFKVIFICQSMSYLSISHSPAVMHTSVVRTQTKISEYDKGIPQSKITGRSKGEIPYIHMTA